MPRLTLGEHVRLVALAATIFAAGLGLGYLIGVLLWWGTL